MLDSLTSSVESGLDQFKRSASFDDYQIMDALLTQFTLKQRTLADCVVALVGE